METNDELVDYLVEKGVIETEKVENAFRKVDRADFTPEKDRSHREGEAFLDVERNPYLDEVFPVKEESTISQPSIVAEMTELLEVEPGDEVLEIGSGSGYQVAVLSKLAERVVGAEIDREMAEYSREKLRNYDNVEIVNSEGFDKIKSEFDKILFSCAITEDRVEEAKNYLKEGGKIVAPVGQNRVQEITVFEPSEDGERVHSRVRFIQYKEED